jgi:hypothetical protein
VTAWPWRRREPVRERHLGDRVPGGGWRGAVSGDSAVDSVIRHEPERSRRTPAIAGWSVAAVIGSLALTAVVEPVAAAAQHPDWPCQQLLVPEIGPATIWSGPSVDALPHTAVDPAIEQLAAELAARKTPLEQAKAKIDDYAKGLPAAQRNEQLTRLFAETLAIINRDRDSIIAGIKRYARGQKALAERISKSNRQLTELASDQIQQRATLSAQRDWALRIYRDRRSSLTYLCEQPDLLEKRAFTLARAIAAHLD